MTSRLDLDPLHPAVQALFRGLDPERELVSRLALNRLCWRCGGDPQWRTRVQELWTGVVRQPRDLQRVMRSAEALKREIERTLTENAASGEPTGEGLRRRAGGLSRRSIARVLFRHRGRR